MNSITTHLTVALGAGLVAGFLGARLARPVPSTAAAGSAPPARTLPLDELEARVAALEERAAAPFLEALPPSAPASRSPEVPDDLVARLERLEEESARRAAERAKASLEDRAGGLGRAVTDASVKTPEREAAERTILDGASTDERRLAAWSDLRHSDAVSDAVVLAMIDLGLNSPDAGTRADVWRQADSNYRSALLVEPLLQALAGDADPRVREEAAETLEIYRSHAGVVEALRFAADNDPEVRRQALLSLHGD